MRYNIKSFALIIIFLLLMLPNLVYGQVYIKKENPFDFLLSAKVYLAPGEKITEAELRDIIVKFAINNDAPVLWITLHVGGQTSQGWVTPEYLGFGYVDTSNILHMSYVNEDGGRRYDSLRRQFDQLREMTRKHTGNPLQAPGRDYMQKRQNFLKRQLTR